MKTARVSTLIVATLLTFCARAQEVEVFEGVIRHTEIEQEWSSVEWYEEEAILITTRVTLIINISGSLGLVATCQLDTPSPHDTGPAAEAAVHVGFYAGDPLGCQLAEPGRYMVEGWWKEGRFYVLRLYSVEARKR